MKKVLWADLTDDDPIPPYEIEPPPEISKHGIRVQKRPPPVPKDKNDPPVKDK
jgi:hypothetical protein